MKFRMRRVLSAIALLLLVPIVLGALHLAAPPAEEPTTSAFQSGASHLGAWARDMEAGYRLQSAVSGSFLIEEAPDPTTTLLVVHGPIDIDAGQLDRHLARGGPVWILDPDGTTNAWLSGHGVAVGPHRLVDPDAAVGTVRLGDDIQVLARSPATLVFKDDSGWTPWLMAPASAHLDLDGNGTVDRIDVPGPHPVGAAQRMPGGGMLFVTADISLITDAFYEDTDNPDYARWVAQQLLPHGGTIIVDESQQGWTSKERLPVAAIQASRDIADIPAWAAFVMASVLLGAAVVAIRSAQVLKPYGEHVRHDPVTMPVEHENQEDLTDVAWELLAIQTKQPVEHLRRAGAGDAAHGLAEDAALRRVLLDRAQGDDHARVLRAYLHTQNPSRSKEKIP